MNAILEIQYNDERINKVRELLRAMESGDKAGSDEIFNQLAFSQNSTLFKDIGKLTRDLHDALNTFRTDTRLIDLADGELPDARERLSYVITMTDQAANKTLEAVELSKPICESLGKRSQELAAKLHKIRRRELTVDEFKACWSDIENYFVWINDSSERLNKHMSDILMAQAFQDLTGQIISRVINLVEELEKSLVEMIRITGHKIIAEKGVGDKSSKTKLDGPQIPALHNTEAVAGQDEVDDILSSLGF
jgi:chemotaxis protein CheZ